MFGEKIMLYLFYDTITGRVISKYSGMNPDLQLTGMPSGTSYIEGDISGDAYILENTIVKVPEKPGKDYEWDWISKSWNFSEILKQQNLSELKDTIRINRNTLLQESDWTDTVSAVSRLGQAKYDEWQTYRQALRDITLQSGYPTDIVWPNPPQ